MKLQISDKLKALPRIDYRKLKEFQGDLKDLTDKQYAKLKKSIEEFGIIVPIFIWKQADTPWMIDAHQRVRVLRAEKAIPYEIPYVEIQAENREEAKKKLLVISSQYGRITMEGLDTFTADLDNGWVLETVHFDGLAGLESLGQEVDDARSIYIGMPDYESGDVSVFRTIHVHFKDQKPWTTSQP
jgi:hypothetical protein